MKYIAYLLIMFLSYNCSNSITTNKNNNPIPSICDSIFIGKNFKEKNIQLYSINNSFQKYLDTIIQSEIVCPFYKKCSSAFIFIIRKSENGYQISVNSIDLTKYDYSDCFGLFYYKEWVFVCSGIDSKEIVSKILNKIVNAKYFENIKKKFPSHNDTFSTWYLEYINDNIEITGHSPCYIPKLKRK